MNHCATCKHWGNSKDLHEPEEKYKECGKITDKPHIGEANDLAYAVDYESYWAWIETQAEFGCVLWEGTEEAI